jgi:hypothetical protein
MRGYLLRPVTNVGLRHRPKGFSDGPPGVSAAVGFDATTHASMRNHVRAQNKPCVHAYKRAHTRPSQMHAQGQKCGCTHACIRVHTCAVPAEAHTHCSLARGCAEPARPGPVRDRRPCK